MSIVPEYPWWFVVFVFFVALAYSLLLYYRNKQYADLPLQFIQGLAALRFILVFILCFLLLSPLVNRLTRKVEKPILAFAFDNSASILSSKDSLSNKIKHQETFQHLLEDLSEKYDVRLFAFGSDVRAIENFKELDYRDKQTDISSIFEHINVLYSNRNLGAVILPSDGLFNKGSNPLYAWDKLKSPVYTIALGDTAIQKDIVLLRAEHNKLTF